MSKLDDTCLRVIDILADQGGSYASPVWGQTLRELASMCEDRDVAVGDPEYVVLTLAVRRLEMLGLVDVDRAHEARSPRATVVIRVTVAD
jgi:hypothetical protein